MFTSKDEYRRLLRALRDNTLRTYASIDLGRLIYSDLEFLGSLSDLTSVSVSDPPLRQRYRNIFKQTIARLHRMKQVTPYRLVAAITRTTREASRFLDRINIEVLSPDIDALYRAHDALERLLEKPVPTVVPEVRVEHYISLLRELQEKYAASLDERITYGNILANKLIPPDIGDPILAKAEALSRELDALKTSFYDLEDLVSRRHVGADPWENLSGRLRAAIELRKEVRTARSTVSQIIGTALEESRYAFDEIGLNVAVARGAAEGVTTLPADRLKGDPGQVKRMLDEAIGMESLRKETKRMAELFEVSEKLGEELELITRGHRREIKGVESVRVEILTKGSKIAAEQHPQYTAAWSDVVERSEMVYVPGSMLPYRVTAIDPNIGRVTLSPPSIAPGEIEAHVEIPHWTEYRDLKKAIKRLQVARQEIKSRMLPSQVESLRGQVAGLLTGGGIEDVRIIDMAQRLLSDTVKENERYRFFYELAALHAPWARSVLGEEDILHSSYIALAEVMRNRGLDSSAKAMMNRDLIIQGLANAEARQDYARRLLREIFKLLPEEQGIYNAVSELMGFIRENIRVPGAGGALRELSEIEAAKLLGDAVKMLGEEQPAYIREIASMSPAQIISMARQGSTESPLSLDYYRALEAVEDDSIESLVDRMLAKLGATTEAAEKTWLAELDDRNVTRFFRRHHREITRLVSDRESIQEFKKQYAQLKSAFAREVGGNAGILDEVILEASRLPYTAEGITITAETMDIQKIRDLLKLQRETGGRLGLTFYHVVDGERVPLFLTLRDEEIIGMNLLTRERFVVGPANAITSSMAVWPIPTRAPGVAEYAGPPIDTPVVVRSTGIPYRDVFAPSGYMMRDIPDVSLAGFRSLRTMQVGERVGIAAIDWETTTLPGADLPFYPTEIGVAGDIMERTTRGYRRSALYRRSILIRPTEEVATAVGSLYERVMAAQNLEPEELKFLGNIAKYADPEAFKLAYKPPGSITAMDARRIAEAANRGLGILTEKGVRLSVGLQRLERMLAGVERRGGRFMLVGQNIIGAEYEWTRHFAELAGLNEQQLHSFTDSMDRFFQNRVDDMVLDRVMSMGRIQSGRLEEQVERYLRPVLERREELMHGTGRMVRRMVSSLDVQHRALEDAVQELAILYSHLGRDIPVGDIRPLAAGEYVTRVRTGPILDPYAPTETGRPARGVFRVMEIGREGEGYAIRLARLDVPETKPTGLVPTGDVEVIRAENPLELARRYHEEFRPLQTEREALRVQQEILDDYARREVLKAVHGTYKFGELAIWQRYGVPSLEAPLEESAVYRLWDEFAKFTAAAEEGPVEPWQELLFGAGYGKRTSSPLVTGKMILEEAGTVRATQRRLRAWPMVSRWLESEEGMAYGEIMEEIARLRALGLLDKRQAQVLSAVEKTRKEFLAMKNLVEHTRERADLFTAGKISMYGWEGELFVPATSPRDIYRRLESMKKRVAREIGMAPDAVMAEISNKLSQSGIISSTNNATALAAELYEAARAGRLQPALVEMRHIPVITTPELRQEFVEFAKTRGIYPLLTIASPDTQMTSEALEGIIAASPLLAARQEKYNLALQQLRERGFEGWHLYPGIHIGPLTVPAIETVAEEAIDVGMVQRLAQAADALRSAGEPVYRSTLEGMGLTRELEQLRAGLYQEMGAGDHPVRRALGWVGAGADLGEARIPVFHRHFPGNIFMRQLKEFSPEELRQIQAVFEDQGSKLQRQTAYIIESYLSGMDHGGTAAQVKAVNQNIINQAAAATGAPVQIPPQQGGVPVSTYRQQLSSTTSSINNAIKQQGAQAAAGKAPSGQTFLSQIDELLPGRWKLIAGIGLAAMTVGFALKPRDKEQYTMEGRPAYEQGVLPPHEGTRTRVAEAPVYRRPVPVEEDDEGYRVRIRGRTRHPVEPAILGEEISEAIRGIPGWQGEVNINTRHDASKVNEQFAKDVFSKLLKQGYIT